VKGKYACLRDRSRRVCAFVREHAVLVTEFGLSTAGLGALGKVILGVEVQLLDWPIWLSTYVPTLPMLFLSYQIQKRIWERQVGSGQSHGDTRAARLWSKAALVQFIAGHGVYWALVLDVHWHYVYMAASIGTGVGCAIYQYIKNHWQIFARTQTANAWES